MKGILGRDLFMRFWWADIPRICVENPVPSRVFCLPEYTQIIQPYQFGHPYSKKTCLWLKNLDPVAPTNIVEPIATWCGKIQRAFPKAYVTMNFELILVPRTNTYINLNHCSTPDEFKAKIIENCSRLASKGYSKPLRKEHLDGINKLLDANFTQEDMEYIYTYLGNGIKHELCMKFVQSGYDLGVIDEGLQAKDGQA